MIPCALALLLLAGCGEPTIYGVNNMPAFQREMRACVGNSVERVERCYQNAYERSNKRFR